MAVQPADDKASAMQIDHRWRRPGEVTHRDPRDFVIHRLLRVVAVKDPAHRIIDPPLPGDVQIHRIGGIGRIGGADKAPGLGVDQLCIIHAPI